MMKENSGNKLMERAQGQNKWMQNEFWSKTWTQKVYQRNAEWIDNIKKEFKELEEDHEANIHLDFLRFITRKKYQFGKRRAMMEFMDSGFKHSRPST